MANGILIREMLLEDAVGALGVLHQTKRATQWNLS
jgi:hypothetical protein